MDCRGFQKIDNVAETHNEFERPERAPDLESEYLRLYSRSVYGSLHGLGEPV